MLCCDCETRSCYVRRHNDLEVHSNFSSSTIYSFSILYLNITTVEINSGVHFRQVPVFTSGGLGLENLILFTSLIL